MARVLRSGAVEERLRGHHDFLEARLSRRDERISGSDALELVSPGGGSARCGEEREMEEGVHSFGLEHLGEARRGRRLGRVDPIGAYLRGVCVAV